MAYSHDSQEREFHLTQQLAYMRKEPMTLLAYHLCAFKGLCDSLALIGRPVQDKMKVFLLLNSLGAKYEPFMTVRLKPTVPSYAELLPLLQGYEIRSILHDSSNSIAFYGHRSGAPTSKDNNNNHCSQPRLFSSKDRGSQPSNHSASGEHGAGGQNVLIIPTVRPTHVSPLTGPTKTARPLIFPY